MTSSFVTPALDNNKRTNAIPSSSTQLTKKQKKALAVAEQKEVNLNRIKLAFKGQLSYDPSSITLITRPEVKLCIESIYKEYEYTIGSYVEVIQDYSKGLNRPAGCGFVIRVLDDVPALVSEKSEEVGMVENV